MNMRRDMEPDTPTTEDMDGLASRINALTEMVISLQKRRRNGEISHTVYMNGLDIVKRLSR